MSAVTPSPALTPTPPNKRGGLRVRHWVLGVLGALLLAVIACEVAGWPFLAKPAERWLSKLMQREVRFGDEQGKGTRLHLFGSIRVKTPGLWIGAPEWSKQPYFVDAREVELSLPYSSLWRMREGKTLHVRSLDVGRISVHAERDADKRSSWQFGEPSGTPKEAGASAMPEFGRLQVRAGEVTYHDALLKLHVDATVATEEGTDVQRRTDASSASGGGGGLKVEFKGTYDKSPLAGRFQSSGALALVATGAPPVPVHLALDVGRVALRFDGTASDVLSLGGLNGVFKGSGPSLAAVGEPLHVTLPSTDAFSLDGKLRKDDQVWNVVVDHAVVGSSRLSGAFQFDRRPGVPLLSGELKGERVLLADLGPTIGAAPAGKTATSPNGRKLPQREFDLPSLRAMNADVRIDFARLELGEVFARPFNPLRAHLVLQDGVLTIDDLDAATADGRLSGKVRLDGRAKPARFDADLRLANVDLGRWLSMPSRKGGQPAYLTGRLDAQVAAKGSGNSTAALLASADGRLRASVRNGTLSHLIVEAGGLDVAQALGLLVKGDEGLKMTCAVADLGLKDGMLVPHAVVIDTRDSTVTVGGSISLADEKLDLRGVVSPKDFSPLTLRSPVLVRGTFAEPRVSLEAAPLVAKVAGGVLLGLITPLAAIIPFIDPGDKSDAASGCRELLAKLNAKSKPAPEAPAAGAAPGKPSRPAAMPTTRP